MEAKVDQLVSEGYAASDARSALTAAGGDISQAIDILNGVEIS